MGPLCLPMPDCVCHTLCMGHRDAALTGRRRMAALFCYWPAIPTGPGGGARATATHKGPGVKGVFSLWGREGQMGRTTPFPAPQPQRRTESRSFLLEGSQPVYPFHEQPTRTVALIYSWGPSSNWQE